MTAPLLAHDGALLSARELAGRHGLLVFGVGRAAGRGFQMLDQFGEIGARLGACGINVAFVYPREAARHAFDATSIRSARYRQTRSLFLDVDGRFFDVPPPARAFRAIYVDGAFVQHGAVEVEQGDAVAQERLDAFFADVIGQCAAG
ncbi:hypothetical protein [Burkholderia sp. WAC0059]|uniref:hypothetical protein n=1 Tax=Burkholderia sp. WAC0059 TaxID=2066022 RepID=UPI0011AF9048|nr:hypothetical protein [Burkholderia sp. WAC0059]